MELNEREAALLSAAAAQANAIAALEKDIEARGHVADGAGREGAEPGCG